MHKNKILPLAFLLLPFSIGAQEVEKNSTSATTTTADSYHLTLDECLQYAFGNSYERQRLKLSEKTAEESTSQSRSNRYPDLSLNLSESAQHTGQQDGIHVNGNASIGSSIAIYKGGSISNTIRQNEQLEEESRLRTAKYDNSLSIEILNSYLSVLKNEETLKYKKSIVETSKEQAEQGKVKYEAGSMLESDYLVLEAQYASNKTDTLDARISRINNLLSLKKLLSMDPMAELSLVEPDTTEIDALALLPSQEECISKAMQTLPELRLSQSAIDIAETQASITKSGYRPTISASANIGTTHRDFDDMGEQLGDNFHQQVGVSLTMPLYDRGLTKSRLAQNKYTKQQAELDFAQTELEVKQTIINQYQNVKLAYERYKMTMQRCNAYHEVQNVYNVKFKVGAVVITDLLQQQDKYISAINEYIQAKYAFILNRKILDVYIGDGVKMN